MRLITIESETFLYIDGKLINIKFIVSVVPSYKSDNQRTMIYISTSDKAIAIDPTPGELLQFLEEEYSGKNEIQ